MQSSISFYIDAFGTPEDGYGFRGSTEAANLSNFPSLKLTNLQQDYQFCLKGIFNLNSTVLQLISTVCDFKVESTICRKQQNDVSPCNQTSNKPVSYLDFIFDPPINQKLAFSRNILFANFQKMFARLDQTASFKGIFTNLWYSSLPCYDVNGITSDHAGEKSLLKSCLWKGQKISCAAIFNTFPTDQGMCCSFNMKAANEIFQQETYSRLVMENQENDRRSSFLDFTVPKWYSKNREPISRPGETKGLTILIDAHNDIFSAGSVETDFQGFTAVINNRGSYPLTGLSGIKILPGHYNMVAMSATKISATDDIEAIDSLKRNCLLENENKDMKIHKSYSQSNCFLECYIFYAQKKLANSRNLTQTCSPWFFPTSDASAAICDPWQAVEFENYFNNVPDEECSRCLPDCNNVIYQPSVTAVPFRRCDFRNLGVSPLCNLEFNSLTEPWIWSRQLLEEIAKEGKTNLTLFRRLNILSSERSYATTSHPTNMFNPFNESYDAFEKDIALVQFYFKSASVQEFQTDVSQTWIDFFSAIGGLLGLCIGISIVTFVELFWLLFKVFSNAMTAREHV